MEKAKQNYPTRLFYLLLACTLSGIGLLTLFKIAPTASAAHSPEHQVQNTARNPLQATTHYTPTLQFVSSMGGDHGDIVLAGDYSYIGNGAELSVVDISDPSLAHEVRLLRLPGAIYDLAVEANHLYVAAGYGGLMIYDISAPAAPKQLAHYPTEQPVYTLYPDGDLLYAVTVGLFQAYDISNPTSPKLHDQIEGYFESYFSLVVHRNYAFIGVQIIDLTNPEALIVAATLDGPVREVHEPFAVVDSVGCGIHGCGGSLFLYDITDPSSPVRLGEYLISNFLSVARIEDQQLYIATIGSTLEILDISDPQAITQVGRIDASGAVEVDGDLVYIISNGLEIIDASDPANPETLDSYRPWAGAVDYARKGDVFFLRMLYFNGAHRQLHIVDATHPDNISVLGYALQFSGVPFVDNFHLDGERAYLLSRAPTFQIFDFANTSSPEYLGGSESSYSGPSEHLGLTSDRAYQVYFNGLKIIDTSDPALPTDLLTYDAGGNSVGLVDPITDERVYLTVKNSTDLSLGMQIVDFSAVPSYTVLGNYHDNQSTYVSGLSGTVDRAYLGYANGLVEILDTSDPAMPTNTSSYSSTGEISSLDLSGSLLFAGHQRRLEILDVSNPYSITLLSQIPVSGTIYQTTISGDWAYLSTEYNGMLVYNISNPINPVFYTRYAIPTYHVQIAGGLAYLSTGENGLQILSLFEPSVYLPYVQINSP